WRSPRTCPRRRRRARPAASPSPAGAPFSPPGPPAPSRAASSLHLLDDLLEFRRHLGYGRLLELHAPVGPLADDQVDLAEVGRLVGEVVAEVAAAALLAGQGAAGDGLRDGQQVVQV